MKVSSVSTLIFNIFVINYCQRSVSIELKTKYYWHFIIFNFNLFNINVHSTDIYSDRFINRDGTGNKSVLKIVGVLITVVLM